MLAVCGGYQLLGRFYRDRYGSELPGAGVLPLHTVAGERRMIGDVLLECDLEPAGRDAGGVREPRRPDDPRRRARSRSAASSPASATTGERVRGLPRRPRVGTYLHGPLLPRNPWLADWLLAQAAAHRTGGEPPEFEPLDDRLEAEAHAVSAARARSRGGRY